MNLEDCYISTMGNGNPIPDITGVHPQAIKAKITYSGCVWAWAVLCTHAHTPYDFLNPCATPPSLALLKPPLSVLLLWTHAASTFAFP